VTCAADTRSVGDSWVSCFIWTFVLCSADFGVSAKNASARQRRDSFIGTPYWYVDLSRSVQSSVYTDFSDWTIFSILVNLIMLHSLYAYVKLEWPMLGWSGQCFLSVRSSCLFINYKTVEQDMLKTNESVLIQIGTSGPRGKGLKLSSVRARRSKVKVMWGQNRSQKSQDISRTMWQILTKPGRQPVNARCVTTTIVQVKDKVAGDNDHRAGQR